MAGPLKSWGWGLALVAIPWILAAEASGAAAEQLAVRSLPEGIAVYVRHDGFRGCHADIHLRIQLDPESTISAGQVHGLVPRIGTAAAERCPVAVAARLEVVRGNQPNVVINRVTALKVKDWLAEPWLAESPVVQLYPARVGWEAKCANRPSLLDKARREPSTAPGWLRGAWNQAGEWVASSSQWIGETAAALSSGQWPGEFRARVADFEAAGASLCVLAQQELNHAGAALGSGRLDHAARYIDQASDLFPRVEAADQAANAYYLGAVDGADTHWEIVFKTSKIAFSVTLAVGTAGGSVAPSAAAYYGAKYGLFNALEFWLDSQEMSLKDAAAKRAQLLAVELLVDGLIGQLLPNDFSYERLVAQGELAKADWLLANVSADLAQQISGGLHPELLRQVAEAAHVQATDAAVRAAIEREILKHGAYFLASAFEEGKETIRGVASNFGPEYLAKRGTPLFASCLGTAFVVVRGKETCDFFLDEDGAIHHRGQKISEPILVSGTHSFNQMFAQSLLVYPSSPSGRYYFIQACEGAGTNRGLCWSQWSFDADRRALNWSAVGKYGPHPEIIWGPDERLAVLFYSNEGFDQVYVINAETGRGWAFPDWGRSDVVNNGDASSVLIERESLVWVDPTSFHVDARLCTAINPMMQCYDLDQLSAIPIQRVLFRLQADRLLPVAVVLSNEVSVTPAGDAWPPAGGRLNYTGITFCGEALDGNNNPCTGAEPWGQDAHYGRDAAARAGSLQKVGAGATGFDYTKIANNGAELQASATLGSGPNDWACTRDNVTGLIWEVKVNNSAHLRHEGHSYTWYDPNSPDGNPGTQNGGNCVSSACDTTGFVQAVNGQSLCGSSDWRMPTRRELQGIVDYGRHSPAIDTGYFPNTPNNRFWSGSPSAGDPGSAWSVNFGNARDSFLRSSGNVRLVRGGL